jgi:hypothetical protein
LKTIGFQTFRLMCRRQASEFRFAINGIDIGALFPSVSSSFDSAFFFGITDLAGISSIAFSAETTSPGGYVEEFGIDNINIAAANDVPEPTTITLLGLGFAGFIFSRKKRLA